MIFDTTLLVYLFRVLLSPIQPPVKVVLEPKIEFGGNDGVLVRPRFAHLLCLRLHLALIICVVIINVKLLPTGLGYPRTFKLKNTFLSLVIKSEGFMFTNTLGEMPPVKTFNWEMVVPYQTHATGRSCLFLNKPLYLSPQFWVFFQIKYQRANFGSVVNLELLLTPI